MAYVHISSRECYPCEVIERDLPYGMVRVRILGGGIVRVFHFQVKEQS